MKIAHIEWENKPRTWGKVEKIRNLEGVGLFHPFENTLYIAVRGCKQSDLNKPITFINTFHAKKSYKKLERLHKCTKYVNPIEYMFLFK